MHGAILAVAPMQSDEAARKALFLERAQGVLGRIEGVRIHALGTQRLQYALARHQRHLTLRRAPSQQDCYFTHSTNIYRHIVILMY